MDPRLIGAYLFAVSFDIAMPIALALYVRRRLGVSSRCGEKQTDEPCWLDGSLRAL